MYYFLQLYFILNYTLYYYFLIQKNHTITFLINIQVMLSFRCISRFPLSITKSSFTTLPHPFINRAIREFHHQNPIDIFNPKIIIVTCTNSAQLTCRQYVMPNIDFVPPDFISFNINQPSQNKMYTLHDIPSIFGNEMKFFGIFNGIFWCCQ